MPSDSGSPELPSNWPGPIVIPPEVAAERSGAPLTPEEQDRIADGEPYCFRCGKPASSFEEYRQDCVYDDPDCGGNCAVDYVKAEEGTYNPDTNRFACDACYIAIGMPVEETGSHNYGWRAP